MSLISPEPLTFKMYQHFFAPITVTLSNVQALKAYEKWRYNSVAYTGIFFGGVLQSQLRAEDRDRGYGGGGGSPLVRGSGGSCNLVQQISFHIVNFS
jgi:hypothetical protein